MKSPLPFLKVMIIGKKEREKEKENCYYIVII